MPARRSASHRHRAQRSADRWLVLRVVLRGRRGDELTHPPGRDLLIRTSHTFAELATAIDQAFGRWDLSHLHEFLLADGRRIGRVDGDSGPSPEEFDETDLTLGAAGARPDDAFEYLFDLGDSWDHDCTYLRAVDPQVEYGSRSSEIVPIFGWGAIPDQYGRERPDPEGQP